MAFRCLVRCGLAITVLAIDGIQISCRGRILALRLSLLLCVYGGDVGSGFSMRSHQASLFPVTNEVFEILYRTHGRKMSNREYRKEGNIKDKERKL